MPLILQVVAIYPTNLIAKVLDNRFAQKTQICISNARGECFAPFSDKNIQIAQNRKRRKINRRKLQGDVLLILRIIKIYPTQNQ